MNDRRRALGPRLAFQLFLVVVVIPVLPLLISQQWRWWQAWAFAVTFILGFVVSRVLVARKHPGYVGAFMTYLAAPVLLNSVVAPERATY